jgi:hypothetical protein
MMETFWKNNFTFAEDVWNIHVNFTVIAIVFSDKSLGITYVPPLISYLNFKHSIFYVGAVLMQVCHYDMKPKENEFIPSWR